MRDRYGITAYQDCDVNGLADLNLDIGKPLDSGWKGRFGTVLNGGTIEHVFDVRQAMSNIHELVRPGGAMIHLAPVTWINHAFVNFNPRMFQSIADVNRYEILVEDFQIPSTAHAEEDCRRYLATKGNRPDTMTERVSAVLSAPSLPSNILYMIAMRKISEEDFNVPYDVTT
ncbi:MAG: hypothetical protein P0111_05815 [Nitrospira sp.]|nr:hypothetical protein [Nitrospira sp.]